VISIIIPTWNQNDMTRECVTAIRETTVDYELIVVDNGSDPPMPKMYAGFNDVTMIRNETNLGFPAAANQGVRAAKGEFVVLLNNDVVVAPGWEEGRSRRLNVAIAGPMTNYCAGIQRRRSCIREQGGVIPRRAGVA
jgi:glycosyltransferase involved in cell wall biosynthesis